MMEIKDELTAHLEAAKARYEAAREAAEAAEDEIRVLDGVLARFDELAKDNTRAFRAVPPAPAPVQNVPDRSAEGVAPRDMKPGVTYLDRNGYAWKVTGEQVREDGVMPMLTGSSGSERELPADQVINAAGPLRVAPNVVDFAEPVPPQPWSQEDAWKPWLGLPITVTYADGSTVTGVLEDTSYRRYRLTDVPGYPADEVYVGSLVSVTGVVSAQPAPVSPDPGGAHPAADLSATRPDEPQGSAS